MRILHITTYLQGGAGRNITDLALAQARAGHDVRVAADAGGEPGYGSYAEYVDELREARVPYLLLTSTFKRDAALNTRAAGQLRHACADWRPGVVHAHAAVPAVVARLASIGAAAPVVNTMHGWGISKTLEQQAADIAAFTAAAALVVPSHAAARALAAAGLARDDVRVIPYGIPARIDSAGEHDEGLQAIRAFARGRRICVCIGTIGERKNQRLLVDALAAGPLRETVAVFIGDGAADALHRHALARGVADRVLIAGHRPRASRYLTAADALVLPSRNEGLPLAVLEALRAGTPVVAARIPEIAEALDEGRCGWLFEPENAGALAAALCGAFGATADDRHAARVHFEDRYAASGMLAAYERLYDEVCLLPLSR